MAQSNLVAIPKLASLATRAKEAMNAGGCGPLIAARDVMAFVHRWEDYREEAGGIDASPWLRKFLNKPLDWFEARAEAVRVLGEATRREMHHEVAVWLLGQIRTGNISGEKVDVVKAALATAFRAKNRSVLSLAQAKPIVHAAVGKPEGKPRACAECERMKRLLRQHGITD
jgi:hypothetical protein